SQCHQTGDEFLAVHFANSLLALPAAEATNRRWRIFTPIGAFLQGKCVYHQISGFGLEDGQPRKRPGIPAFPCRLDRAGGAAGLFLRLALVCGKGLVLHGRRADERLGLAVPGLRSCCDHRPWRRLDGASFLFIPPRYGPIARIFWPLSSSLVAPAQVPKSLALAIVRCDLWR